MVRMGARAYSEANERIHEALSLARGEGDLPQAWLDLSQAVGAATNRTYTSILGTALLARASFDSIDATALQLKSTHGGYNARGLHTNVLWKAAVIEGFDLRDTGREAYNNSPFFRKAHMRDIEAPDAEFVDLHECLHQANQLNRDEAMLALAAFLRVRLTAAANKPRPDLDLVALELVSLIETVESFIDTASDRGTRAQALAAASFDLVWPVVLTAHVNDPSRRFPGDVQVLDGETAIVAAEVRDKYVSPEAALTFASSLERAAIPRGFIIALNQGERPLDRSALSTEALTRGVLLHFAESPSELLENCLTYGRSSLEHMLGAFPRLMLDRLTVVGASEQSKLAWAASFVGQE